MTLTQAKQLLDGGAKFGSVYEMLANPEIDGLELKAYFVFGGNPPGVNGSRSKSKSQAAKAKGYEGDACGQCGQLTLRRTGPCCTCDSCGSTTGGCS